MDGDDGVVADAGVVIIVGCWSGARRQCDDGVDKSDGSAFIGGQGGACAEVQREEKEQEV